MNSPTTPSAETPVSSNGSPTITSGPHHHHEPEKSLLQKARPYLWLVAIAGVIFFAVGAFAISRMVIREPYGGPTFTVARKVLQVTIVERGTLESAENSDIVVRVKAGAKGSTIASTIKWVIDDGTHVKAGDRIVELDDSGFQEQLKTQKNTVNKSFSDFIESKAKLEIQASQNESDIKTAEVVLNLSELDLEKYVGKIATPVIVKIVTRDKLQAYLSGKFEIDVRKELALNPDKLPNQYLQELNDIEGRIEIARSDRETWLDRASWSQRMVKKGYYSPSQADADQSRLNSADISLRKVTGELDIYRKYEMERKVTKLWSDYKEAERARERVMKQAEAKMEQVRADYKAKKAIYDQEEDRLHEMEGDEKYYKIVAPQDGMIVYYIPEQSRFGSGSQQSTVAQGEPVREGQKLIRIPNLNKMLVNARVHEAMVSKVRGELTKPTGSSDRLRFTFSLGRFDVLGIASYQLGFEEARERYREEIKDKEQVVLFPGHSAAIRVDAHPGKKYSGRVKSVATIAAQAEFFSSDIKVYQTMVSIDNLDEAGLKPGMSAEVTIKADETSGPVIVAPIQAIVGNVAMGAQRKCYVLDSRGYPQEREITLGLSSTEMVEVKEGLQEGDKVVLNPKVLIPEKSDLKAGVPGTRRGGGDDAEGGGKKGGKKMDGKGPGPAMDQKSFQRGDGLPNNNPPMNKK